ncbi:retropepsin-like aspartic protease family protein [Rhodoferax saidenbachensis]|uniref:Peptidase A2 n=1 Tax=Rhodoferax saidenbachensis TaxID=1484693 RepID=A0A1P8K7K1_9BURK|nr:TIGR02281 family clan AA aspartic protease [Rhodoferax saidenbachensis]APW41988.1 peptidase A2 [Rhodoferax saidenbachensis]
MFLRPLAFTALLFLLQTGQAQTVALSGMMGGKALVIVDGSAPKSVAPGETWRGVKIVSTQGEEAVVEIAGKKHTLRVGDAPASVGGGGTGGTGGTTVVLTAGSGGHFFTQGQINGRSVQLVVDTGASVVSLSVPDAERIGLNYQGGQRIQMSTANGVIPGWRMKLASVRVGDVVVYDVDAVVSSGAMPYVLLGNSFLSRFQMTRTNDQMVLEKRY